ncbi:MAG: hypothetical protein IKR34_02825 [Candidatus Gastranaerophilales bacterium]|nr:hypothetical protein [Candidatus Gastranaerophilales bacterium]
MSVSVDSQMRENNVKIKNKGVLKACYTGDRKAVCVASLAIPALIGMRASSKISDEDSVILNEAVKKGLEDTGLAKKGVRVFKFEEAPLPNPKKIIDFIKTNKGKMFPELVEYISNIYTQKDQAAIDAMKIQNTPSGNMKGFVEAIQEEQIKLIVAPQFKFGLNACYLPHSKSIITPDKHRQTSVFHEMGHALNANGGAILKNLQKMRMVGFELFSVILLVSLLNKRKTTDSQKSDDTVIQRGADFVKRNAKKLTILSFAPMVLEEGIATIRGEGIARNLLKQGKITKSMFAKTKIGNLLGLSTYVLGALAFGMLIDKKVKTKDKIQREYEYKLLNYEEKPTKSGFRIPKIISYQV